MTNEKYNIIIISQLKVIIDILFVLSIVTLINNHFLIAGALLIFLSVVNIFYYGLAFTIFWELSGIGLLLLGYEKSDIAILPLALAFLIISADIILWINAIKKYGLQGLLRIKIIDRPKIYARKEFYKENEITCILWNNIRKKQISGGEGICHEENVSKTMPPMTNEEQRKFITFIIAGIMMIFLLISAMICIVYDKYVWSGIFIVIMGIANIYFIGLSFTIALISGGLTLVSVGYEIKWLSIIFGSLGIIIIIANLILINISIAKGAIKNMSMLSKDNRFVFIDELLKKTDIIYILLDKMKHRFH